MPETPPFRELEHALSRSGVMADVIERTIGELKDHYVDLLEEAARSGIERAAAETYARERLGRELEIAAVVRRHDELLRWSLRHPFVAACGRSVAYTVAIPIVPVVYCAQRRESLARWSVSFGLATVVTASMLLALRMLLTV